MIKFLKAIISCWISVEILHDMNVRIERLEKITAIGNWKKKL